MKDKYKCTECGTDCMSKAGLESHIYAVHSQGQGFITKDSGKREDYASGMRRDTQDGKPSFFLMFPDMPYELQPVKRFADLLTRGADKYGRRNWQLACSDEELERFKESAFRHFVQWVCGEEDEDHMAAVMFNLLACEHTKYQMKNKKDEK